MRFVVVPSVLLLVTMNLSANLVVHSSRTCALMGKFYFTLITYPLFSPDFTDPQDGKKIVSSMYSIAHYVCLVRWLTTNLVFWSQFWSVWLLESMAKI